MTATLARRRYGGAFGVDIAIGEPIVGSPQPSEGDDLLTFVGLPVPMFWSYPVATHVAEKLHAYTMPRPRPKSRVKELPDLALLATLEDLDSARLRGAISETFTHRGTHVVPASLPTPPSTWEPVYARMAAGDDLPWQTLGDLVDVVRAFLDPVLAGTTGRWDPQAWRWRREQDALEPKNADNDANGPPGHDR